MTVRFTRVSPDPARCLRALGLLGALLWPAVGVAAPAHEASVRIEKRQVTEPASRRLVLPHKAVVTIRWHGDEAGELHVHGYDLAVHLRPDEVVSTRFEAKATGRFPVTSHGFGEEAGHAHGHGALLYIEVHPE